MYSYWASTGACWLPDFGTQCTCMCMYNIIGTYAQCSTRLIYWHHMYLYACNCMHTHRYVCVYVIIIISRAHLQGALEDMWLQLIWSIKSKGICIYSLYAYSFWTAQKGQFPTLSNHISALIMHESRKKCSVGLFLTTIWISIVTDRLTVHTHLIIYIYCTTVSQWYTCLVVSSFLLLLCTYVSTKGHLRLQVIAMVVLIA